MRRTMIENRVNPKLIWGEGANRLNPYKIRKKETITTDKYIEIDNFCL